VINGGISGLPPIFMAKGAKPGQGGPGKKQPAAAMNQTKKSFSTIRKIKDHKKSYVSPYSIHAVRK
jgi:hypothetical protein